MKRLLPFLSFALGCVACMCVLIATEQRATAMYVDPGTGLVALQSAASLAAAAAFFLRKKIRAVFGFRRKPENDSALGEEKGDTHKAA
jgi:hypothetical protein